MFLKLIQGPLHEAAFKGNLDIVKMLLQKGANVNALEQVSFISPIFIILGQKGKTILSTNLNKL